MLRLLAAALALLPGFAAATNGYFAHGYSAAQRALGGAGTALAEDALVSAINPAALAFTGDRLDLNLSLFAPRRDFTAFERGEAAENGIFTLSPGTLRSGNERFLIPGFARTWTIDERRSWGLAVYGNGGMNTQYAGSSARFAENLSLRLLPGLIDIDFETECAEAFGGGAPLPGRQDQAGLCGGVDQRTGVDLIQLFIAPGFAWRVSEGSSIGITALLVGQRFAAEGLSAFAKFSNAPEAVSGRGHDLSFGYGARLGVFSADVVPGVNLGASYQTRVRMTDFDKYRGLFAEEGGFDIPSSWNLGLALRLTEHHRLAFDVQHIRYSEVRSVGNPLDPNRFVNGCALPVLLQGFVDDNPAFGLLVRPPPKDPSACLGAATGPGFGWRDLTVYKLGYQWRDGDWTYRMGYSRNRQPIPADEVLFNVLAPGVVEQHYTAGLSWQFAPRVGLDLALMYAADRPVRGQNPLSNIEASLFDLIGLGQSTDQAFGIDAQDQVLIIDMHQWELTVGLSWRF